MLNVRSTVEFVLSVGGTIRVNQPDLIVARIGECPVRMFIDEGYVSLGDADESQLRLTYDSLLGFQLAVFDMFPSLRQPLSTEPGEWPDDFNQLLVDLEVPPRCIEARTPRLLSEFRVELIEEMTWWTGDDMDKVDMFAKLDWKTKKVPPLVADTSLRDGFHRLAAGLLVGRTCWDCITITGQCCRA